MSTEDLDADQYVSDPSAPALLTCWVHDPNTSATDILVNPACLPSHIRSGDVLKLTDPRKPSLDAAANAFLFKAPGSNSEKTQRLGNLQVSLSQGLSQALGISNRDDVSLSKIIPPLPDTHVATHIELFFKDQYVSRSDMHRITMALVDNFAWDGQRLAIPGTNIKVRVGGIKWKKKQRFSAYISHDTRVIFRSDSAKFHIFVQLSSEMWSCDIDGSLFYEKTVDLFLPELVRRWKYRGTNHIVSLILCGRIFYTDEEAELLKSIGEEVCLSSNYNHEDKYYKDVYKVLVDLETQTAWDVVISKLKEECLKFHSRFLSPPKNAVVLHPTKSFGMLSAAHDGNVLEAINLAVNAFSHHYVDRDLQRTGLSVVLITAGTCQFHVDKNLLRLTGERIVDLGGAVDIVSLAKMPLHQVPLFSFYSDHRKQTLEISKEKDIRNTMSEYPLDALYEDVDTSSDETARCPLKHYVVPAWVDSSFFSRQPDKPFRIDRFMPRCKMVGVQNVDSPFFPQLNVDKALSNFPRLKDDDLVRRLPPAYMKRFSGLSDREKRQIARERYDSAAYGNRRALRELRSKHFPIGISSSGKILGSGHSLGKSIPTTIKFDLKLDPHNHPQDHTTSYENSAEKPQPMVPLPRPSILNSRVFTPLSERSPGKFSESSYQGSPSPSRRSSVSYSSASLHSVAVFSQASRISASGSSSRSQTTTSSFTPSLMSRFAAHVKGQHPPPTSSSQFGGMNWLWPLRFRRDSSAKNSLASSVLESSPSGSAQNSVLLADSATDVISPEEGDRHFEEQETLLSTKLARSSVKKKRSMEHQQPILINGMSEVEKQKDDVEHASMIPRSNSTITGIPRSLTNSGPLSISPETPPLYRVESGLQHPNCYYRFNPSNPKKNLDITVAQRKRWENIFSRRVSDQRSMKWRSLCTPACLPLYTDFYPSVKELQENYTDTKYVIPVTASPSSILVRPGNTVDESVGKILQEMIFQRLAQNFQIIVSNDSSSDSEAFSSPALSTIPLAETPGQVSGMPVYLSMSNHIHKIQYIPKTCEIQVTIYRKKLNWRQTSYPYTFSLWAKDSPKADTTNVQFMYHTLEDFDFKFLDRLIGGLEKPELRESLRYWRARFCLIPGQVVNRTSIVGNSVETLDKSSSDEEIRLAGILKLVELFERSRWKPPSGRKEDSGPNISYVFTTSDPGVFIRDEAREAGLHMLRLGSENKATGTRPLSTMNLDEIAKLMTDEQHGVNLADRRWHLFVYEDTFIGHELIDWLLYTFPDVHSREDAFKVANDLYDRGLFVHVRFSNRRILDGHFFYRLDDYARSSRHIRWFRRKQHRSRSREPNSLEENEEIVPENARSSIDSNHANFANRCVKLSNMIAIDLDPFGRSERSEVAFLHFDVAHHPNHAFHIQIDWLCKPTAIQDLVMSYARLGERYGLRLVEENIRQIKDINMDNPLQKPVHIPLSQGPPDMGSAVENIPDSILPSLYLERRLLERLGYVLDLEADDRFPSDMEPDYVYRSTGIEHVQFVHLSGAAFVQILGGEEGYLFLKNRLFLAHRTGASTSLYNELRETLEKVCADHQELERLWSEELTDLERDGSPNNTERADQDDDAESKSLMKASFLSSI